MARGSADSFRASLIPPLSPPSLRSSLTNNFKLNVFGHNARGNASAIPGQYPVTQQEFETLAFESVKELWTQFGNLTEIWFVRAALRIASAALYCARLTFRPPAPTPTPLFSGRRLLGLDAGRTDGAA